jgi:hypothetical protein
MIIGERPNSWQKIGNLVGFLKATSTRGRPKILKKDRFCFEAVRIDDWDTNAWMFLD